MKANLEAIDDVSDPELPMTLPSKDSNFSSLNINSDGLIEIRPKHSKQLYHSYQEVVEKNINKILVEIKGNRCF